MSFGEKIYFYGISLIITTMFTILIRHCIIEDSIAENNKQKWQPCIEHLYNISKSVALPEAKQEINNAIICLKDIEPICTETTADFNSKLNILNNLAIEFNKNTSSISEDEALLQKANRVIFDSGQSCYKGRCNMVTHPFICQNYVDPSHNYFKGK